MQGLKNQKAQGAVFPTGGHRRADRQAWRTTEDEPQRGVEVHRSFE